MNNKRFIKIIITVLLTILSITVTIMIIKYANNSKVKQNNFAISPINIPTNLIQDNNSISRENLKFKFIKTQPQVDLSNSKLDIPYRIVLTVGENPSKEVNISWSDDVSIKKATVLIGVSIGDNVFTKEYKKYEVNGEIKTTIIDGGTKEYKTFELRINDLLPGTEYVYTIGNGLNWSEPRTFKTLDHNENQTIGFFGDMQGYKQSQYDDFRKTYEVAVKTSGGLDISLLAGDLVDDSPLFEQWMFLDTAMNDYLSTSLFAATPGNHDVKDKGVTYASTFLGPLNGLKELKNMNYYFECGNAIIACIDTECPSLYEQQKLWLKEIMDRTQKAFKIVFMHRSAYPMNYNELRIRKFVETFEQCDIDLVLSGHDHIYNRTTMYTDKKVNLNEGITYVVGGSSSGSKYYHETNIVGGRYWENIVFDEDERVFSIIKLDKNKLCITAYAINDEQIKQIDKFSLIK